MPRRIGWGLIGASTIAREYMVPAIRTTGEGDIAAVYSRSPERGASFAATHGIPRFYDDLQALLDDAAVDAVYVSTTNERHASEAILAATAGKHVLCEKPLATTLEDAGGIVRACRRAKVVLGTNHHLPNAVTHRAIRRLIAHGAIGEPLAVRVFHARWLPEGLQTWRTSRPEAGAGVILDVTVHDAALVRFLLGDDVIAATAVSFSKSLTSEGIEDSVMGIMEMRAGVAVQFHDAWNVPHAGTGIEVHGTEASIAGVGVMTSDPVGSVRLLRCGDAEAVETEPPEDLYAHAVRHFHAAMTAGGEAFVTGDDGLRSLAVALTVKRAAARGERVEVPELADLA